MSRWSRAVCCNYVGRKRSELTLFIGVSLADDRAATALWTSADEERRIFGKALALSNRKAEYLDLVQIGDDNVHGLYAAGDRTAYEMIDSRRVSLGSL
ncbi:sialidase-1 [Streptomyces sp. DI166]|nr:sialidase-1 [Streptomyces sp. DI166]